MYRCDIGMAMLNGSKPIFFNNSILESLVPYPDQELLSIRKSIGITSSQYSSETLFHNMNESLAAAWNVMQRFCSIVNLAVEAKRMILPRLVYDTMASVMYRLLRMSFDTGSADEAVRLGLLAFTYHTFLQWQYLSLPHAHFHSVYKNCLLNPKLVDNTSSQTTLWLLVVGATSVFPTSDYPWLKDRLREHIDTCHVKSWKELRDVLKSFLWIGILHDKPGKHVFDSITP